MRLPFFIARRYLFSKKKQNAINIISCISVIGVTIGTTALIVVLSVFNGMDLLLQQSTDSFTPDLVISPVSGKYAHFDNRIYNHLANHPAIASYHKVIEEKALARYEDNTLPVIVKGVEENYGELCGFNDNILQGEFQLKNNGSYEAVLGFGVAAQLDLSLSTVRPFVLYYPDKKKGMNASALNTELIYPSAFFSSQQEIDAQYVITDIGFAAKLFGTEGEISKIEIRLHDPSTSDAVKAELADVLDEKYRIEDKYELNKAFYAMMKSEKLAVFLILLFILLIASFNIVGSISMLILDKKEDLATYRALGMTERKIISVFKIEGNLITLSGCLLGLIIGTGICLLQEKFGFITLGDGSYIIDAYPVKLEAGDIIIILLTVAAIGYTASYFPVRYLVKKLNASQIKTNHTINKK